MNIATFLAALCTPPRHAVAEKKTTRTSRRSCRVTPGILGVAALVSSLAMAACNERSTEKITSNENAAASQTKPNDAASSEAAPSRPPSQEDLATNNPADFVPPGGKILDSQRGDLDGQGDLGALLIFDPPASRGKRLGDGEPRTVMLLIGSGSAPLRKVAENSRIIPCAKCGGLAGDPYGYSRIEKGRFTIAISGGSRQRWSAEYLFEYSPQSHDWHLQQAKREAYDQISEDLISKTFTPKDFGQVSFSDFDPSIIEEVALP